MPFKCPDKIDAILILERANSYINLMNQTLASVFQNLGIGQELNRSIILMITDWKAAPIKNVTGREDFALKTLGLGGCFRWESVTLTDEERAQQFRNFFALVETITPFKSEFLKTQQKKIEELAAWLVHDVSYWKTESKPFDKKVGEECIYSPKTLLIKGVEEYDKCMESKFHGNKLKKVGMMALTTIYSFGTMPSAHIIKHASEIEQNNMKAVTVRDSVNVPRPPTVEEMIPVAREIVR